MILITCLILLLFSMVIAIALLRSVKKTNALNKIYRQRLQKKIFFSFKFFLIDSILSFVSFFTPIGLCLSLVIYLPEKKLKFPLPEFVVLLLIAGFLLLIAFLCIPYLKRILYQILDEYVFKNYYRKAGSRGELWIIIIFKILLHTRLFLWFLAWFLFTVGIVYIAIYVIIELNLKNSIINPVTMFFISIAEKIGFEIRPAMSQLLISPFAYYSLVTFISIKYMQILHYRSLNEVMTNDKREPVLFLRTFENEYEYFWKGYFNEKSFAELREISFIKNRLQEHKYSLRESFEFFYSKIIDFQHYNNEFCKQPFSNIIAKYPLSIFPLYLRIRNISTSNNKIHKFIINLSNKQVKVKSSYTFEDFFDEIIYEKIGPFIALGNPNEHEYKFNGAIREYHMDENWKTVFHDYLQKSKYVFLTVSNSSQNLNWEILTIKNLDFLHKLFVFTKPQANNSQYEASWVDFANQLNQQGFSLELTFPGYGCLITFDNDGKQIILVKDAQMPKEYLAPLLKIENDPN